MSLPRDLSEELVSDRSAVSVRKTRARAAQSCELRALRGRRERQLGQPGKGSLGPALLPLVLVLAQPPACFVVWLLSLVGLTVLTHAAVN